MTLYVLDSHKKMVDSWRDRHGTLHKRDRRSKRLHTADMTPRELARVVAGFHDWYADSGGWVRNSAQQPIIQGWEHLAGVLQMLGVIEVGKGVHWRRMQSLAVHQKYGWHSIRKQSAQQIVPGPEYSDLMVKVVRNGAPRYRRLRQERYEGVNA